MLLITWSAVVGAQEPLVQGIIIEGNEFVDDDVIKEMISQTQVGETISEEGIMADLQAIADLGYFWDVGARLGEAEGGANVIFWVEENPVVEEVIVKGSTVLSEGEIAKYLSVVPGDIINARSLTESVQNLSDTIFSEYGVALRPADLSIEGGVVTLEVVETRLADIKVAGNEKTKDHVILRELRVQSGDVLQMDRVYESLRRVLMLGFFEEVRPLFTDAGHPDETVLTIEVKERKTGTANFGAGYSSVDKFIGYVEVSDQNFLGRGQEINVRWEFGKNKNTYDLSFHEPHLDSKGTSLGASVYNRTYQRTRKEVDYTDKRTGGSISIGRPLGDYTRGTVRFKLENVDWDFGSGTPEDLEDKSGSTRSVTFALATNTTDHPFYPTKGFRSRLSAEVAGKALGGDADFVKYEGDFSKYIGLADRHSLAFRVSTGTSTGDLPEYEYYWVGGADTVRGYSYGDAKGEKKLVINSEYRVRLVDAVQGVLFVDFGNAWKEESMDFTDLNMGYGIGVRLDTPLGIIRIDYGIGEDGGQTYFSFGQSF
jgi:outer membrane protein insertion porin family